MGMVPTRPPFAEEVFNNQSLSPTSAYSLTKWNSGRMEVLCWLHSMELTTPKPTWLLITTKCVQYGTLQWGTSLPPGGGWLHWTPSSWAWQWFFFIGVDINSANEFSFPLCHVFAGSTIYRLNGGLCPSTLLLIKKFISKRKRNLFHGIKKSNIMG